MNLTKFGKVFFFCIKSYGKKQLVGSKNVASERIRIPSRKEELFKKIL